MSATRNPSLGPSPMRARKRRLFLIRLIIILFFLAVIIFGLAILSGNEKVKIQTVNITGQATISDEAIRTLVSQNLAGRYWLFSKSNSLIFPRFAIKKDILQKFKAVKEVKVSFVNWQTISIEIVEKKPHSVWCGSSPSGEEAEPACFFVDKEGYIYNPASAFSGNMFVRDYAAISTSSDPVGQYFLLPATYQAIFSLIQILDQNNLKVVSLSYDGFDYKFGLEKGPVIIFNNKSSLSAVPDFNSPFANFFTAIETKNLDLEKEANTISYIDLRFDNKIVIGKNPVK